MYTRMYSNQVTTVNVKTLIKPDHIWLNYKWILSTIFFIQTEWLQFVTDQVTTSYASVLRLRSYVLKKNICNIGNKKE